MYHLAFDIGNTSTKVGHFEDTNLLSVERYSSSLEAIEKYKGEESVIVSSVVEPEDRLQYLFSEYKKVFFFRAHSPIPIGNCYGTPGTLGVDRLAAAVGANARFPNQDVLIVDIGTAIKYDLVDAHNNFLGGIISPGRRIRFQALHTFTGKLPLVDATDIPDLLGTSTETCIQSGVMNGIIQEINGVIKSYQESYNPRVLLCGGDARYFETQIKYPTFAAPNLVLEGLIRILLYNVAEA
ncbi:type III pantothenate kinase [Leadbetterella byssophila]|uniref:Type III pantothenate kinase n=1 Tax=Leadbetterella byssophila (strain DSM 17132 / JCM 16389 / KACC 11308 / NBRC 106382 / 4M15) TaxID=649349 RepID=E4RWV0_LEAB4|nr:type III pantothenate kinase [Leadbetterella byssophila]ADQ17156.1 putative transcriptional acitvator, Baf family [Leadbetterella byssophila DSM 17132]